jgi:hypothetical protein
VAVAAVFEFEERPAFVDRGLEVFRAGQVGDPSKNV